MEKPVRSKGNNMLKFLPKPTSFSIPNDKRSENSNLKAHNNRGFSGPIILIPAEARRKPKNGSSFEEPTSPKVSCMGQIKHKKKKVCRSRRSSPPRRERKPAFTIGKMFRRKVRPGRPSDMDMDRHKPSDVPAQAPSLGQLRRFTSGRDTLAGFDWKAPGVVVDRRHCYMDEDSDEEDEIIIPHSAPILMGGGAAMDQKKEVNLWKRRTMARPTPLQMN